jgi:HlyD family secretion protein
MKMADLSSVRVRTLVDETDIGKISPDMEAVVTVSAYPNQPFSGTVQKIEPQAIVEQNVTMFAVMIVLENQGGLLLPGMNAEVTISIVRREASTAAPTMALRTGRDIYATAAMIGMAEDELRALLGKPENVPGSSSRRANTSGRPERGARRRAGSGADKYLFGADYWVLVLKDGLAQPRWVRTGITDYAFSEVVTGLDAGEDVLLLPSSALFESRERMQGFMTRRFGTLPGMQRQES